VLGEADIIALLRPHAGKGARSFADDCAVVIPPPGRALVLTKDMLAQGVHFLPDDPPETVAHKLLAVNLSDLAAKGAVPMGCLLGLGLPRSLPDDWLMAFINGLGRATQHFACPLLGGDTIRGVETLTLSLTAIGHADPDNVPDRRRARPGDLLCITGSIGDAGLALRLLQAGRAVPDHVLARYRMPEPHLGFGQAMAPLVHACCDVSDGLLRDAANIAASSGVAIHIEAGAVPLGPGFKSLAPSLLGGTWAERLRLAAAAGDDYELLFTLSSAQLPSVLRLFQPGWPKVTVIGQCYASVPGDPSIQLVWPDGTTEVPEVLGYQH
jgi:thiamine-monophosphate kinase